MSWAIAPEKTHQMPVLLCIKCQLKNWLPVIIFLAVTWTFFFPFGLCLLKQTAYLKTHRIQAWDWNLLVICLTIYRSFSRHTKMVFEKKRKIERRYTVYRGGKKIVKTERAQPSRSALSRLEPVSGSSKELPSSFQADCHTDKGDNTETFYKRLLFTLNLCLGLSNNW